MPLEEAKNVLDSHVQLSEAATEVLLAVVLVLSIRLCEPRKETVDQIPSKEGRDEDSTDLNAGGPGGCTVHQLGEDGVM